MGAIADLLAALAAVRETIDEARTKMHEGAEKYGDAYGQLKAVFDGASNPKATGALAKVTETSERVGEADEHAVAALAIIGEYIQVVKGYGSSGTTTDAGTKSRSGAGGGGYDAEAKWRGLPAFPPKPPRHTHGSATGKDGETTPVVSGEKTPDGKAHDWRYVDGVNLARRLGLVPVKGKPNVAADVELKWALQMRRDGVTNSQVTINHPDGPCRGSLSCDQLLPTWLKEDSHLTVHWRDGDGTMRSRTYVGRPDHD